MKMESIIKRIGQVLDTEDPLKIAQSLNYAQCSGIGNYLGPKARKTFPWERLFKFAQDHGLMFEWLMTGHGPMYQPNVDDIRELKKRNFDKYRDRIMDETGFDIEKDYQEILLMEDYKEQLIAVTTIHEKAETARRMKTMKKTK
jgi:hypothetical protein